jgi:hypothetical protein
MPTSKMALVTRAAGAKAQAAAAASQVNGGAMPERGQSQPGAEQKAALYAWASCGTPN